jgi:chemotaxis-related protein WspD
MAPHIEPEIDACWKRIGIQGDKSCAELPRHSHCRNCPRFSQAAALLLDRDMPVDHDAAPATAKADRETARRGGESLMVFRLGVEWFALPTLVLDEILRPRAVHSLPHRGHPGLLGLVNVRGELVICVSMAQLLVGITEQAGALPDTGRLIVVRHDKRRLAFPVDEVRHLGYCDAGDLTSVPATLARSSMAFTRGLLAWNGGQVGRLDQDLAFAALERFLA